MLVALKNDPGQIPQLLPSFDFAVDEQCFQYGGCGLDRFVAAGKPAFDIEYQQPAKAFCPAANRENVNVLVKHLSLDAWRVACRAVSVATRRGALPRSSTAGGSPAGSRTAPTGG